jgi:carbonic anhydrase
VNCTDNKVSYDDKVYVLESLDFHTPSEHTVSGSYYSGEVQFVHTSLSDSSDKLVVSVFLKESLYSIAGTNNEFLSVLWENGGVNAHELSHSTVVSTTNGISPYDSFTPGKQAQYHYTGSLTTPNCTAGVPYFIFEEAITVSQADLELLRNIVTNSTSTNLDSYLNNNRPTQSLNNRTITFLTGGIVSTPAPTVEPTAEPTHMPTDSPVEVHKHLRRPRPMTALVIGSVALAISCCMIVVVGILLYEIMVSFGYDKKLWRYLFGEDDDIAVHGKYKQAPSETDEDDSDEMGNEREDEIELVGQSGNFLIEDGDINLRDNDSYASSTNEKYIDQAIQLHGVSPYDLGHPVRAEHDGYGQHGHDEFRHHGSDTYRVLGMGETHNNVAEIRHAPHLFPENANIDTCAMQTSIVSPLRTAFILAKTKTKMKKEHDQKREPHKKDESGGFLSYFARIDHSATEN